MTPQNQVQATVFPLYAVPMLQAMLPNAESVNHDLTKLFLNLEAEGERHRDTIPRDTQHGIFESNFYLHQRGEASVQHLFGFIRQTLRSFIQGISQYSDEQMAGIKLDMHSWFHITRRGGYQSAHNHPNASWSAIYCVDPGDSVSPQSGAVRFHDPRHGSEMYRDPTNENMQVPYREGAWKLDHKPGQMVAFPSYLVHEVFPYEGERPRIVVALNSWCRQPDQR